MSNPLLDRRNFILATSAGMAGVASQGHAASNKLGSNSHGANPDPTAPEILQELLDGNDRFVTGNSKHPRSDEDWLKRLTKGQQPLVTILACSDSRVPLELVFDQGFGDIFAIRVAGNVVTRYGIGSIEYAQHHLNTKLFMVLGHEGCGAVTAALLPEEKRAQEPKGVRELLDLVNVGDVKTGATEKTQVGAAVEANAKHSARQLMSLDHGEEGFMVHEDEMLVTAVYELSTGRVRVLEKFRSRSQTK